MKTSCIVDQWVDFATNITAFGQPYFIIWVAIFKKMAGAGQRASKAAVDQLINDHVETF
jgi:hypothetical protein